MLTRAYCHAQGVTLYDHQGRRHGWSLLARHTPPNQSSKFSRPHSESERIRPLRPHRPIGIPVLPASYTL